MDVLDENGHPIEGGKAFVAPVTCEASQAVAARIEERRQLSTEAGELLARYNDGALDPAAYLAALENPFFAGFIESLAARKDEGGASE